MALALSTASDEALAGVLAELGEPAWRVRQLRTAAWQPWQRGWEDIVQLPAALRARLGEHVDFLTAAIAMESEADSGNTVKLLCRLADGQSVETVAMETPGGGSRRRRATVCVSSQAGCAVGCPFCATGRLGLLRSLTAAEIADQVRLAAEALHRRGLGPVTHIVFMGMGEPLANYDEVIAAIRTLIDGAGISPRRITVSTSGVVPGIERLAAEGLPLTLAVSLHAADDSLRDRLVPLNRRYGIAELSAAAGRYAATTGRRISLEWCLIGGVNDSPVQAEGLRDIAGRLNAHVNVIPMNHIDRSEWGPPEPAVTRAFLERLRSLTMTVRDTRGGDTDAACGQLRAGLAARRHLRPDGTLGAPRRT